MKGMPWWTPGSWTGISRLALGPWGFADACLELFERAKVTEEDIREAGGKMKLFRKESFFPSKPPLLDDGM